MEVEPLRADFTEETDEVLKFIAHRGKNPFTFYFIDPTGWSPLKLAAIGRLLSTSSSEVLINFMTSHIKRFLEACNIDAQFSPDYMKKIVGLAGQDRDDQAAYSFADEIRKYYRYTTTAVVPHPLQKQAYFHLIYGTRHPLGLRKFKEAEKSSFGVMETARLDAQRRQVPETGQGFLFEVSPVQDQWLHEMRERYKTQAFSLVREEIRNKKLTREQVWELASRYPLVWESDLSDWWEANMVQQRAAHF